VSNSNLKFLTDGVLRSDRRSISELISIVENDSVAAREVARLLHPMCGRAAIVGITGVQGVGKSTLISALAKEIRKSGETVGIVAVDPSSRYSGGAFLGDRIRMQELANDDGVFIRSMASRGHTGGLARATADAVRILNASRMDYVIVETVGAGQTDLEIREIAETVILTVEPDLGDEIQTFKAGLTEICDIFVVNKADKPGSDRTALEIEEMLRMRGDCGEWRPVVIKTIATQGVGMKELIKIVREHQKLVKRDL
jgi:LAO/AO transport system kinase